MGKIMRKVIYAEMVSIDGFIEGPNQELDWHLIDEELHRHFNELENTIDIHLYGRRLYENMAAYWPSADENPSAPEFEVEYARIWRNQPKIVFSKTLQQVDYNARLVREVNPREIRLLKEQPGKDMSLGGAELAATFMKLGLIDEYQLYVNPVVVGGGTSMFPALNDPLSLQLLETRTFDSGVVLLRYQPAVKERGERV
jgi:dihydrofolate reductase